MKNDSILQQLTQSANLTRQQAEAVLTVVSDFAKERFPILEGTINSFVYQELAAERSSHPQGENER